jgi:hypothetical protein
MEEAQGLEETDKKLVELLDSLEMRLKQRVLLAPDLSPETLFEELEALDLVLELKKKLKEQ